MKYNNRIKYFGLLWMLPLAIVSCTDTWDSHYDEDNRMQTAEKTLWEEIESRPELNEFAQCLKTYGYDKLLDGDQMFTVFAPEGTIDTDGLTEKKIQTEVLENHIARYAHSANSATVDKGVTMLNKKVINFTKSGDGYIFGNNTLSADKYNIIAQNGVLHVIGGQEKFFHNIWEYLTTDARFDKVRTYLYSFNDTILDENASVKGDIVNGKQEYVDSVIYVSNDFFYNVGKLDDEDSTYTMIVPTNDAWDEAYERVKPYYKYPTIKEQKEKYDSLQQVYTGLALVSDLVFSHTVQTSPEDQLVSTYPAYKTEDRHVFEKPFESILYGYTGWNDGVQCSNGSVFVVDRLRHKPWESWHTRLKVEGELSNALAAITNATEYRREIPYSDPLYTRTSSGAYLESVSSSAAWVSGEPSMVFNVWNNLAGKYDVKIVFMPQSLATSKEYRDRNKANRFNVLYACRQADGTFPTTMTLVGKRGLTNNPSAIDTVDVGTIELPVCAYGEENAGLKIRIESNMSRNQWNKNDYSKAFMIDCIILEPSKD